MDISSQVFKNASFGFFFFDIYKKYTNTSMEDQKVQLSHCMLCYDTHH